MAEISEQLLSGLDKKILAELDKNCRTPSSQIAKKVRRSRQTIEYRIKSMVEAGIITNFVVSYNPHKMGYKVNKVFFKLRNIPLRRKELLVFLRSSDSVIWVGECAGAWDVLFGVFTKTDEDFFYFKNNLISNFSDIILEYQGKSFVDAFQYPKMYFTKSSSKPVKFVDKFVNNILDELDFALLGAMVHNARIPTTELAQKVNSTPRIVVTRLKKLESMGVIIQYRLGVNLPKLGLEHYKAIIKFDKYSEKEAKKLFEYVSKLSETQYLIQNMWDIEVEFVVNNNHEYYALIEGLKEEFPYSMRSVESVQLLTDEWGLGFNKILKV
ncbi:MAG: winged helix-turn-helix transcriptional regulator [Candidatus Diapherotrites archaeon]|nr:winged helix-turn-helix transcriptional regulator [Candidatus Diapherotrites archaeon]